MRPYKVALAYLARECESVVKQGMYSVSQQSHHDFEVESFVVLCGPSSDGTEKKVRQLAGRFGVTILEQDVCNRNQAKRLVLEAVSDEPKYVLFLDGAAILVPGGLETYTKRFDAVTDDRYGYCYSSVYVCDPATKIRTPLKVEQYTEETIRAHNVIPSTALFRYDKIRNVKAPEFPTITKLDELNADWLYYTALADHEILGHAIPDQIYSLFNFVPEMFGMENDIPKRKKKNRSIGISLGNNKKVVIPEGR